MTTYSLSEVLVLVLLASLACSGPNRLQDRCTQFAHVPDVLSLFVVCGNQMNQEGDA